MSPIHVDVHVNSQYVKSYHIGRAVGIPEADSVNTYWIVEDVLSQGPVQWKSDYSFQHRYGDGIDVCIQKGLEAINDAQ